MGTIPCLYDTNTRFLLNNGNHPVYGAKNTRYICLIIVTIPFVTLQIRYVCLMVSGHHPVYSTNNTRFFCLIIIYRIQIHAYLSTQV